MRIVWTKHAEERQKEWQKKRHISREEVESLIENPVQVVDGDLGILVAQAKMRDGLLRIPFIVAENSYRIITVYWTSKIEKYWKEEK